jgi:presenilin-like A22 family membrane protease
MKHSVEVTLVLLSLFLAAQIIGLFILDQYREVEITETGEINITYTALPSIGGVEIERPEIEPSKSVWIIAIAVAIGTVLLLFLIRMRQDIIWRIWFFLAVLICLTIAFGAFIGSTAAFIIALVLSYIKVFRPGIIMHNLTELFIYGGLAAIFVPILDKLSVFVLLVLISIYDMYAVWKSKHMIKLAKFQTKARIFSGMLIPYNLPKLRPAKKRKMKKVLKKIKIKTAILGGGDIGFPLLFAGVVMNEVGLLKSMIIPVFVTISLVMLLLIGKKKKFYPAMPFLSIGCLAGYAALKIVEFFILLL